MKYDSLETMLRIGFDVPFNVIGIDKQVPGVMFNKITFEYK